MSLLVSMAIAGGVASAPPSPRVVSMATASDVVRSLFADASSAVFCGGSGYGGGEDVGYLVATLSNLQFQSVQHLVPPSEAVEGGHVQIGNQVDDPHCSRHQLWGGGGGGGEREERGEKCTCKHVPFNSHACRTHTVVRVLYTCTHTKYWAQILVRNNHVHVHVHHVMWSHHCPMCMCVCVCVCACVCVCTCVCVTVIFDGSNAFHSST